MAVKVKNNAETTIAGGINSVVTIINLAAGTGASFPTLTGSDWFYGTLIDDSNNLEVVKVTARSTDALTVVRGQDGTTARSYSVGDRFELRPTAALFDDKADLASPSFTTKITTPAITLGSTALTATGTELNYVAGVTSAIQAQLNTKAPTASPAFTGTATIPTLILTNPLAIAQGGTGAITAALAFAALKQQGDSSTTGVWRSGTSAEQLAGALSTVLCTPGGLASDKNLAQTGHYVFPGGFIVNWGLSGAMTADSNTTLTFDKAYTTACYGAVPVIVNSSTTDDDTSARVISVTQFGVSVRAEGMSAAHSGTPYIFYIAVGK